MNLEYDPLFTPEQIQQRVAELGAQISADYAGSELVLIVVLKGGLIFAADLMRRLTIPVSIECISASSYQKTVSTGLVQIAGLPDRALTGRRVLVIEDIVDTGRTLRAILDQMESQHPKSLAVCALLEKPGRREVAVEVDYVGFNVGDAFVVGYGLDYEQRGRELPGICILRADPEEAESR